MLVLEQVVLQTELDALAWFFVEKKGGGLELFVFEKLLFVELNQTLRHAWVAFLHSPLITKYLLGGPKRRYILLAENELRCFLFLKLDRKVFVCDALQIYFVSCFTCSLENRTFNTFFYCTIITFSSLSNNKIDLLRPTWGLKASLPLDLAASWF